VETGKEGLNDNSQSRLWRYPIILERGEDMIHWTPEGVRAGLLYFVYCFAVLAVILFIYEKK